MHCTFEDNFPKSWHKGRKKVQLNFQVQVQKNVFPNQIQTSNLEGIFRVTSEVSYSKYVSYNINSLQSKGYSGTQMELLARDRGDWRRQASDQMRRFSIEGYFSIICRFLLASVGMELFHAAPQTSDGHMYLPACGLGFQTFW